MKEKRSAPKTLAGDHELRRLLAEAGPRPEVPAAELAAIRAAARDDWRRMVASRRGWRAAAPLALAATLIAALALGWLWRAARGPAASGAVATVELAEGALQEDGSGLGVGAELAAGARIATWPGPARLALRLAGGESVRLDAASGLRLAGASILELERGAVYVDSGGAGGALEVRTALGSVRDVGTQFEVRLGAGDGSLKVRVREGSVELERGAAVHAAVAGEQLTVAADGSLERQPMARWGEPWRWVLAAAPPLEISGLSLDDYLAWLARETGWEIRFADNELARSAAEILIHGSSIGGLAPDESVHVVVPATGFEYRLDDGVLLIEP